MALITAAQAREALPDLTGTGEDTELDKWIARAGALMALYCGWPKNAAGAYTLEQSSHVLYPLPHHAWPRALDVGLPEMGTPTAAYVDEDWDYAAADAVTLAEIIVDNDERVLWLKPDATSVAGWSTSPRANQITLPIGLSTVTDEIIFAAAMATKALWEAIRTQGIQQITTGGTSATLDAADKILPPATKLALSGLVSWRSRAG